MFKLHLIWRRLDGNLWFRPTLWSLAAVVAALMAALANYLPLPAGMPNIGQSALEGLLTIIASSMLTVSTFSLSILVSAFASASSSATPRATRLVMADDSAQQAISAFIASFIFAMVALTALGLDYYGDTGRFVLLVFTIYVLGYLILALLRWIGTLSRLGRMSHTIETVENAGGRVKTLSQPADELGRVHRHIEHGGQYVEIHRRSGQAAGHVVAGVPG
jgi:uncharacterized membrane protein